MTPVTLVGLVAGSALLLAAIVNFLRTKEFPAGGITVCFVGLVLIGMSQWSSIKISNGGIELEKLSNTVRETATAAAEVAVQAERAAAEATVAREQLAVLTRQTVSGQALSNEEAQRIRRVLDSVPKFNPGTLRAARESLQVLGTRRP